MAVNGVGNSGRLPHRGRPAWLKSQETRLSPGIKKLGIPYDLVASYRTKRSAPALVFLIGSGETTLYVHENAVSVQPDQVHLNYSVLFNTRDAFMQLKPMFPNKLIGFVFDPKTGWFAMKQATSLDHLTVAESFSLIKGEDKLETESKIFLKGIFIVDSSGDIKEVKASFLGKNRESPEEDLIKRQAILQIGLVLVKLGCKKETPVIDYIKDIKYLEENDVKTLEDLLRIFGNNA